jgi:hypothetical protein
MSAHEVSTLSISVVCCVIFVILSAMVFHAVRSLSRATPATANGAPLPVRPLPPRRPARRRDRDELDRARLRHAHRLATGLDRNWNRDDLMRLEPADVVIRA